MAVFGAMAGCTEPGTIGRFRATPITNIILEDLGVVDEEPSVFVEAREPNPKDLLVVETEYIIQPGDIVDISIYQFLVVGQEQGFRRQVSETGRITLPVIGTFRASGQTEMELTETIRDRLSPRYIKDPTVTVIVTGPTKKIYSISGAVAAPGPYQLGLGDFRISQALAQAGGIPQANADYAYVIRNVRAEDVELPEGAPAPGEANQQEELKKQREVQPEPPTVAPPTPEQEQEELLKSIMPPEGMFMPVELAEAADILEQMDPYNRGGEKTDTTGQEDLTATKFGAITEGKSQPGFKKPLKIIREGNQFLLVPTEPEAIQPPVPVEPVVPPAPVKEAEPLFEWEKDENHAPQPPGEAPVPEEYAEGQIKEVIRVNLKKLRGGDYTQNITIRAGDDIQIPFNTIGLFSVMGQVARPGVFSLTGQRLTLKQAIAAAGPLTPLAVPNRCEIIRRIGENQEVTYRVNLEKLFTGTAPDIFLKPNDIINVGSHPTARFIAVLRQSFRSTYGFGFVYDRNLADKDIGH